MNVATFVDKMEAHGGADRLQAIGEQLGTAKDECTEALVRLARVAHGDPPSLDAMEGLALAVDRLAAVRQVLESWLTE